VSAEYRKPLPEPSEVTRPFWEGLAAGELRLQRCQACAKYIYYPRSICPHCMSDTLRWERVSGRGRLYSYTVVRRAMNPAFAQDLPYVYAIVELEEGPRVTTNIVNCGLQALRVDMPLKALYDKATGDITLLKFEPA
jgi:uncharacterized OB-fold protein